MCGVEAAIGRPLFIPKLGAAAGVPLLEALLRALRDVLSPDLRAAAPQPADFRTMVSAMPYPPLPPAVGVKGFLHRMGVLSPPNHRVLQQERKRERDVRTIEFQTCLETWQLHDPRRRFQEVRQALEQAGAQAKQLAERRERAVADAALRTERDRFLQTFRIRDADIRGIGDGRKAILAGYGIETAADVTKAALAGVPGFGSVLSGSLLGWRNDLATCHKPGHITPDAATIAAVDVKARPEIERLMQTLRSGKVALERMTNEENATTNAAKLRLVDAAKAVAQANANLLAPAIL